MTWARLRRDVDDIVDLADARRLGVGGFTAELLGNDEGAGR
jgi:2-phospho-L-lactate guanylyltransferase (CobY/MobA/RfbA family)